MTANQLKSAAEAGNIEQMAALIKAGDDIDGVDSGHPPIVWAAARNQPAAVRWLLDNGAEPNRTGSAGWHVLMSAASGGYGEIAQMLMDAGANPQYKDPKGKGPISVAQEKGHKHIVRMLSETPDEVVFTEALHDRMLEEVYSFKRGERFILLRKGEGGDVEAMQRESFSDIRETPNLRRAFELHKKRGGKLTEEDVFGGSSQISKPKRPGLST